MSLILSQEQCLEARHMREHDDKTYAQVAKHFGVPVEDIKHAIAGTGDYAPAQAPKTGLDARVEAAEAMGPMEDASGDPDIKAARADRPLTEEEVDKLEAIYRTGQVSFETMAAALDPPVHWLTVSNALGERGWYRPDFKTITYSTSTEEGKARFAREMSRPAGVRPVHEPEEHYDPVAAAKQRTQEKVEALEARRAGAA